MAAARAAWPTDAEAGVGGIAPERLVFLDECGVLTGMARLYGRGRRGERARAAVPHGPWARLSVLGALGHGGMLAVIRHHANQPPPPKTLLKLARTRPASSAGRSRRSAVSRHASPSDASSLPASSPGHAGDAPTKPMHNVRT